MTLDIVALECHRGWASVRIEDAMCSVVEYLARLGRTATQPEARQPEII